VHDVTQDRRAEAVRRDFVANVSHELRTPLASVRAMAEALRDGALEDPQLAVRFLGQMLQEVDRMSRLVNDLLDLSALEAGVVRLRWEDLEAEELLEAVARRYAAAAERKGVALVVQPGKARVWGDRDRLEQALGNLVDNAVKYTPSGGQVVLKVEQRDGEVCLVVEDTGPGIPPEHLPRVFERFYRADPSRSRAEGGTGLGLAITKHIALAHGGRVEAANLPTGGARLAVVLPAAGGRTSER
ncbi:MAG: cell wall metabolism sensor histidine kinase WalK, partial [Firmicutes bacterium]|nr:cell wall metabolism sensor histidine kinase WalK [Bacillota bacterium]